MYNAISFPPSPFLIIQTNQMHVYTLHHDHAQTLAHHATCIYHDHV